jgi:AAA+ ATPase superfamily predicted ATPase
MVELHAAWGGVPRYWELAREARGKARAQVLDLVLDPMGPLHQEPERLLLEELPPALDLRPLLDVIGAGAHRVSEIAGRLGRQATSMARPLDRLLGMGLIRREVPFGESEKESRRSLYKIDDPFSRLWFRVVAPNRALLTAGTTEARKALLDRHWDELVAQAFEELCRRLVPRQGMWNVAGRWWQGAAPEWDIVAESLDGRSLLLGEVKWSARPVGRKALQRFQQELETRPEPALGGKWQGLERRRALFVPALAEPRPADERVAVYTLEDLLRPLRGLASGVKA